MFKKWRIKQGGLIYLASWIVIQSVQLLFKSLVSIENIIAKPIQLFITKGAPTPTDSELYKLFYLNTTIATYIGFFWVVLFLLKKLRNLLWETNKASDTSYIPTKTLLYEEQIAATLEVIDSDVPKEEIEGAVEDLMRNIGNTIMGCFKGISPNKFRFVFLVPNDDGVVGVRLGRQASLTNLDSRILTWLLTEFDESHILRTDLKAKYPNSDMEAVGLVRNPGTFRLGFLIMIPDQTAVTEEAKDSFYATSTVIQLFAYMDKLRDILVEYSIKRGGVSK